MLQLSHHRLSNIGIDATSQGLGKLDPDSLLCDQHPFYVFREDQVVFQLAHQLITPAEFEQM